MPEIQHSVLSVLSVHRSSWVFHSERFWPSLTAHLLVSSHRSNWSGRHLPNTIEGTPWHNFARVCSHFDAIYAKYKAAPPSLCLGIAWWSSRRCIRLPRAFQTRFGRSRCPGFVAPADCRVEQRAVQGALNVDKIHRRCINSCVNIGPYPYLREYTVQAQAISLFCAIILYASTAPSKT